MTNYLSECIVSRLYDKFAGAVGVKSTATIILHSQTESSHISLKLTRLDAAFAVAVDRKSVATTVMRF